MTLVSEVAAAVGMITDVVRNTRTLVAAVNDGRAYLRSNHPDAAPQFADLLGQMETTLIGLADVTALISDFRFVPEEPATAAEAARFNNLVIERQQLVAKLGGEIRTLKGSCEKLRKLRDTLDERSGERRWGSMFGLLGDKARQRSAELAGTVSNFYADDQRMIDAIQQMLQIAQRAMEDVSAALGPPGFAYPHNVPDAATVLGTYATVFTPLKGQLDALIESLDDTVKSLT
jgi:hypothetical protein